jgi:protein involved in polysaccharide export with SLBB domain
MGMSYDIVPTGAGGKLQKRGSYPRWRICCGEGLFLLLVSAAPGGSVKILGDLRGRQHLVVGQVMGSRAFFQTFWLLCALVALAAGCASPQPFVWAGRLPAPDERASQFRVGPGDEIYVLVADQQALSGTFTMGPDGSYVQPVVGNISLNGLTTKEAAQQLTARLSGILVRPQVTVSVTKRRAIRVSVIGQVQKPGRFEMPYDESLLGALANAGGLNEFADEDAIYVVRREPHLLRIRFRLRDLAAPDAISARFRLNDSDVVVVE